jgi:predicted metal-dependent phosphoesterase TrpH
MLKADLHIHSIYSGDSNLKPDQILKKASQLNLDVVGIVDHGSPAGALEARKLAKKYHITVLIGQEIRTNDGEIIVFGIDSTIPSRQDIEITCKEAKLKGGLIILPHPFDPFRHSVGKVAETIVHLVDAIEIFNSNCILKISNKKAELFAKKYNLPGVAGSDAHNLSKIGKAITMIDARPDQKAILSAIKLGKVVIKKPL